MVGRAGPAFDRLWPAPQIEAPDDSITDWNSDPAPAGFGPISPFWQPRQCHAGTYDQTWVDHRHPLLPDDFDERFWQCTPPDQVITPWLRGTERFELRNLHAEHARLSGALPGIMLGATIERPGMAMERVGLNLDGVHFDLRPDWERVVLTWRVRVPMPQRTGSRVTVAERARLQVRDAETA